MWNAPFFFWWFAPFLFVIWSYWPVIHGEIKKTPTHKKGAMPKTWRGTPLPKFRWLFAPFILVTYSYIYQHVHTKRSEITPTCVSCSNQLSDDTPKSWWPVSNKVIFHLICHPNYPAWGAPYFFHVASEHLTSCCCWLWACLLPCHSSNISAVAPLRPLMILLSNFTSREVHSVSKT